MPTHVPDLAAPALWISAWFLLSNLIVTWDAFFLFLRPRSMKGGDLHWIWEPYGLYETVDLVYGPEYWLKKDGFPAAQAAMNVVEIVVNYIYLYRRHVSSSPDAPIFGLVAATMTWAKTMLYWLLDYLCGPNGWCSTGHNEPKTWWLLYAFPNGWWIVVPFVIMIALGQNIARSLKISNNVRIKAVEAAKMD